MAVFGRTIASSKQTGNVSGSMFHRCFTVSLTNASDTHPPPAARLVSGNMLPILYPSDALIGFFRAKPSRQLNELQAMLNGKYSASSTAVLPPPVDRSGCDKTVAGCTNRNPTTFRPLSSGRRDSVRKAPLASTRLKCTVIFDSGTDVHTLLI